MNKNLYLYQQNTVESGIVYEFLKNNLADLGFNISIYSVFEMLPPEKAQHSGDSDMKKVRKKEFEDEIKNGRIDAFAISNQSDLSKPNSFVCYFKSKKYEKYEQFARSSIHISVDENDIEKLERISQIFDEYIKLLSPVYGFQCDSKTIYKGITYSLSGSVFENELANFVSYLSQNRSIDKMRMVYPVNYLTDLQLEKEVEYLKLTELLHEHKDTLSVGKLLEKIHKIECSQENILEINEIFGKKGFLASWYEPSSLST